MTLDTRVLIEDPIDPEEVFNFMRGLLRLKQTVEEYTRNPDMPFTHEPSPNWNSETKTWEKDPEGEWSYSNQCGQGLVAWLIVYYNKSGPHKTQAEYEAHNEDCHLPGVEWYDEREDDCDGEHNYRRPRWVTVSFDTAYGYTGPNGQGCGDLHAEFVAKLGQFLDHKGVRWIWENEFTGEFHRGYDRLSDLGRGGEGASEWFQSVVLPAIAAGLPALER